VATIVPAARQGGKHGRQVTVPELRARRGGSARLPVHLQSDRRGRWRRGALNVVLLAQLAGW
jgi:hypothetical protein